VLSKLTDNELQIIRGEQVGLAEMLEDYNLGFYTRQHQSSLGDLEDSSDQELIEVSHKSLIFMLMMSKDDNLMLQMGGLISVLVDCRFFTPDLKEQVPELFTLASQAQKQIAEPYMGMRQIKSKSDLLSLYFEVLTTDMPFRNLTLRLYTRML